ncbi:MAG TPA: hypothetical protein VNB24_08520 [Acidimicrobiales bacterium]|nr:hypothetical protein [Acidimicrobiales bacterium]
MTTPTNERFVMKKFLVIAAAALSVFSIGRPPDLRWITERPICVDAPASHVCGPTPADILGA